MNARSTFNHILKQVEFSQLNYLISKTPLSAYISMKWSFVKSYDKPDHDQVQHFDAKAAVKIEDTIETSDHHDKLKEEVLKLKFILVRLEETIVQQKHVIQIFEKSAEDKRAEFREEVLKVKREKKEEKTYKQNEIFGRGKWNVEKSKGKS